MLKYTYQKNKERFRKLPRFSTFNTKIMSSKTGHKRFYAFKKHHFSKSMQDNNRFSNNRFSAFWLRSKCSPLSATALVRCRLAEAPLRLRMGGRHEGAVSLIGPMAPWAMEVRPLLTRSWSCKYQAVVNNAVGWSVSNIDDTIAMLRMFNANARRYGLSINKIMLWCDIN